MRLSVFDTTDPKLTEGYEAFLDGEKVAMCAIADEELGEVHVYKLDEHGKFIFKEGSDDLEIEKLQGKVEIRKKPSIDDDDIFADVKLGPPAASCDIGCESCQ
jgi:hypothetical protein